MTGRMGRAKMSQCGKGFEIIPDFKPVGEVIANIGLTSIEQVGKNQIPGYARVEQNPQNLSLLPSASTGDAHQLSKVS